MTNQASNENKVESLIARGVIVLNPASVWVSQEVEVEQISPGVVIYPGVRLLGKRLSLGPGCVIGAEGPATIKDCQLESEVELGSGYFCSSVFLRGARVGSEAHVRPACLLEEHTKAAHAVGLKQTILMPFVTLGSLINLCDCLVSGGRGADDHTEVGSSYVHFNFTPRGDKATASLVGDVPRGVLLNEPPIFLGGQGGLVGPARIAFGTVIAAGVVWRRDVLEEGMLVVASEPVRHLMVKYDAFQRANIRRVLTNGFVYLGNLFALREWYRHVRSHFLLRTEWGMRCHEGALSCLDAIIDERQKRLAEFCQKIDQASKAGLSPKFAEARSKLEGLNLTLTSAESRLEFLRYWKEAATKHGDYVCAVQGLPDEARKAARIWLQGVVDEVTKCGEELY